MRRMWPLAVSVLLCIICCGGCGSGGSRPAGGQRPEVALLTSGDVNDAGWNQLGYEALQAVQQQLGARTAHQVTRNPADQLPALRDFGNQKVPLVICHGFEYGQRVLEISNNYPATDFVVVAGNVQRKPNVATMIPKLEDAAYLLGMAAAGVSKTGKLGFIGGMKLPVIFSTYEAFAQGAKAINPNVSVAINYVGDFEDQNKAHEIARLMIAQHVDVLFHNADQAGKGMFNAAEEAGNVLVFGSNRNQNDVAPKVCLGSAVINLPKAFVDLARDVRGHKFKPGFYTLDLSNGDVDVEWNSALKSRIPPSVMTRIETARQDIQNGALKIERDVPSG